MAVTEIRVIWPGRPKAGTGIPVAAGPGSGKKAALILAGTQAVALIAYMDRLGVDLFAEPAIDVDAIEDTAGDEEPEVAVTPSDNENR